MPLNAQPCSRYVYNSYALIVLNRVIGKNGFSSHLYTGHSILVNVQSHLAKMYELVELNLTEAASDQKWFYDIGAKLRPSFAQDSHVWLSIPTAGKLDPKWERGGL